MQISFLIKDCIVKTAGNLVEVISKENEILIPITIKNNGEHKERYLRVRYDEKEKRIKADLV